MSYFQKQLIIHKFPLPLEVLRIIKDFCFTLQTEKTRRAKSLFMGMIKNSSDTEYSANPNTGIVYILADGLLGYDGKKLTNPFWNRYISYHPLFKETILKRAICNICGNFVRYRYAPRRGITYARITCKCHRADGSDILIMTNKENLKYFNWF